MPNDVLEERFGGPDLDPDVWLPHYLPAWSSRAQTRASWRIDGGLRLDVPVDHPVWCPGDHTPALRISGLQTGTWSHTYAVECDRHEAVFTVDDRDVRRCPGPPTYPLQLMLAVFDFPEWSIGGDEHLVPELVVEHMRMVRRA